MKNKVTLKRADNNTFEMLISVPKERIAAEYQKVLAAFAKQLEAHGFRKGNVPLEVAEEKIGKENLRRQLANQLIPLIYAEEARNHQLEPIGEPKIEILSNKEGEDWQIKISGQEKPKINLGDYKEKIRALNAQEKIWTPEKGADQKQEKTAAELQKEKEERFQKIITTLLNTIEVDLPASLIEAETKRKLASLIAELQKVGMSLDDYSRSQGKTINQIEEEYRQQVSNLIKLELILEAIANQEHITVSDEDLQKVSQNNPKVNNYILAQLLRQQKVLEYLSSL